MFRASFFELKNCDPDCFFVSYIYSAKTLPSTCLAARFEDVPEERQSPEPPPQDNRSPEPKGSKGPAGGNASPERPESPAAAEDDEEEEDDNMRPDDPLGVRSSNLIATFFVFMCFQSELQCKWGKLTKSIIGNIVFRSGKNSFPHNLFFK